MSEYRWVKVSNSEEDALNQLKDGRISKFFEDNYPFCLVSWDNKLFAFEDKCPHQAESFAGGNCKDGWVECPVHKYKFALSEDNSRSSLNFYPIRQDESGVYVGIKKGFWS